MTATDVQKILKQLLEAYYEGRDNSEILELMHTKCWRTF